MIVLFLKTQFLIEILSVIAILIAEPAEWVIELLLRLML